MQLTGELCKDTYVHTPQNNRNTLTVDSTLVSEHSAHNTVIIRHTKCSGPLCSVSLNSANQFLCSNGSHAKTRVCEPIEKDGAFLGSPHNALHSLVHMLTFMLGCIK